MKLDAPLLLLSVKRRRSWPGLEAYPTCWANKGFLSELMHVGPWTGDWFDLDTSKLNNQLFSSHLATRPNRHISNSRHDTLMMMLMVAMLASSLNELLRVVFLLIAFAGRNRTFPMTVVCPYFLNFLLPFAGNKLSSDWILFTCPAY